jgi:hypothetical protein
VVDMKGFFSFSVDENTGQNVGGAVLVSVGGLLINQDLYCCQTYEKKKCESIIVGACNDVLIMLAHFQCAGEKCECFRMTSQYFCDRASASDPTAFFDVCQRQLLSSYFVALGHTDRVMCFQKLVDKTVRQEILSLGTYSLG